MRKDGFKILLVEDDEVDVETALREFSRSSLSPEISVARNGREGLKLLHQLVEENPEQLEIIVLLDINMPVMNGHEFLAAVRADEKLRSVIIFMLSTSTSEQDTRKAYSQNVAGYLVKGGLCPKDANVPEMLDRYFQLNIFPPNRGQPLGRPKAC